MNHPIRICALHVILCKGSRTTMKAEYPSASDWRTASEFASQFKQPRADLDRGLLSGNKTASKG